MKPTSPLIARIALLAACWIALEGAASAQSLTILHRFGDHSVTNDGSAPTAPLVLGVNGNYYGVTSLGGSAGNGTIFTMTPSGTITILHSFGDGSALTLNGTAATADGSGPVGLILASDGNFYGTTSAGGSAGMGTVFEMRPGGTVTVLHNFGDNSLPNDGATPLAGVIEASDGNLYGTTSAGGVGRGTVYQITKAGAVTILHAFAGIATNDGADPVAPLVQGSDGKLYGTTEYGGAAYPNLYPLGRGTVFLTTLLGTFQTIHKFGDGSGLNPDGSVADDGSLPVAGLVQGSDGNFYGTTSIVFTGIGYGYSGSGTVFKITPNGTETVLHSFYTNSLPFIGVSPHGGLLLARDGNFYGTTLSTDLTGQANQYGTIFQVTPQGQVTFLHNFGDGTIVNDGAVPLSALIQGADGNLYGDTQSGGYTPGSPGGNGFGTLFEVTLNPPNLTSPATTSGAVGNPFSYQIKGTNNPTSFAVSPSLPDGLVLDASTGLITGTPAADAVGTTMVTLTLTNSNGSNTASLTLNIAAQSVPNITSNLNLYGTVNTPLTYTISASNSPTSYGASAFTGGLSGLSVNSSTGVISGTPTGVGTYQVTLTATNGAGQGVQTLTVNIFATPPTLSQEYSVLHRFQGGNDGQSPSSALVQGLDGSFYGVTYIGGSADYGTFFKMSAQGVVTILYSFIPESTSTNLNAFYDGGLPEGIILGSDGNFYGMTHSGGTAGLGTVFKFTPDGRETILHNFGDFSVVNDGALPVAGLVQGSDGNFYGTTYAGGHDQSGVVSITAPGAVFKMTPQGVVTILHGFGDGTVANDGSQPYAALIQGSDGSFYGTTESGGSKNQGTIYSITSAGAVTILHSFGDGSVANDGSSPSASLIQASDGNFYGTTRDGGSFGNGVVFKMTLQGVVTTLYSFGNGNDGASPTTGLVQGFDGNLYGTTGLGGSAKEGTIFQITTAGQETIIHQFGDGSTVNDGAVSNASLYQGRDGNFYGTTFEGGAGGFSGDGVVFLIEGNLAPKIPPTIIGATTVYSPYHNPLLYAAQALQSQSGAASGITGDLVKAVAKPASTSLFSEALSFFLPAEVTPDDTLPSPTRWLLAGDQTPILPPNLAFNSASGTTIGTVTATPGVYTFSITPKNDFGTGTQRTVTMYIETNPTVNSIATDTASEGKPYSYQVEVADYDFPVSYSATHLPSWLSINTTDGSLTGTPPGPGTYVFNPIANNLAGSTGLQVRLTVAGTSSSSPTISSATDVNCYVGTAFAYQIAANNNPTSYSALTLPPGLLFNNLTGQIFGTPTTPGTYLVPISASNATSTYASVLNVTVEPAGAPLVSGSLAASGAVNNSLTYQIPVTGSGITYSATGLPAGLVLDPSSGIISGTPTATGVFNVAITATNGVGTCPANLTLTVTLPPLTFSAWEALYPTLTDTAPGDCPEHDGVTTLLKYLYNINPTAPVSAPDRAAMPTIGTVTIGGTPYLTLTYRQNAGLMDTPIVVQTSSDLQTWTPLTQNPSQPLTAGQTPTTTVGSYSLQQVGTDSTTGDPIMEIEAPYSGARQFIQLNVASP